MAKVTTESKTLIYPMPTLLIGANVGDQPNFMTAAWSGIVSSVPPMITVGIRPDRHTLKGILQNLTFSVNVPSVDQVREMDYCGIVSGTKTNKAKDCRFILFYGKLHTAPMIEQCPVNLECIVVHTLELGSHTLIVGRIEETYISDDCLTSGEPDVEKIRPLTFVSQRGPVYLTHGEFVAKAFNIGREIIADKSG
ncbi:flavin reductase family protein [Chloroflexota bacterium]